MVHGNDRAPVTSTHEATKALFAPKTPLDNSPVSQPGQPAEARKPRVLPALTLALIRQLTADVPAAPKHPGRSARSLPKSRPAFGPWSNTE